MTKNTLLNIAIVICKFLRLFYITIFIILSGLFVHYQISPSTYKNIDVKANLNNIEGFVTTFKSDKIHVDGKVPEDSEVFTLNQVKYSSLYLNFVKLSIVIFLSFLCIKEFQKIIESVKEIKTFQNRNIASFRKIGKYLLVIFVLISYTSITFEKGGFSGVSISFNLLFLALLAFIMAEIFKEGNNLSEESKLTI